MQLAASLAARFDHPVSKANAQGLSAGSLKVTKFKALPGRGVEGMVGGRRLVLGDHSLVRERDLCGPALEAALAGHEHQGHTVTLLAEDSRVLALFAVADTIRETSRQAIVELKALGIASVMLTGDNQAAASTIAAQAGINDAPAPAQADIGFAVGGIGTGTDTAMEAADVVIMNDNLPRVPETIRLSRRTHAVLWQNIMLALGIKVVFLVLAMLRTATMWMAVFADMGASLLVVANGLRRLRRI